MGVWGAYRVLQRGLENWIWSGKEPCTLGLGALGADLECAEVNEQNKA